MLKSIFILIRSIELAAETAYRKIANETTVDEQKAFWLEISQDEKRAVLLEVFLKSQSCLQLIL